MHHNIQIIYYLFFYCFTEKKTINESLLESSKFAEAMGISGKAKQSICNIFAMLRKKIKDNMHKRWSTTMLSEAPTDEGFSTIEIDESSIIGNSNIVYWMFGLIQRITKEVRIYCVLYDRTKNNFLSLVKNNVSTENIDNDLSEEESCKTRIYSECFASYDIDDFRNLGFILKRVNHSVWFGYELFHTNNVESLWGQIKRYCNNFSGLSIEFLQNKFNNNNNLIRDYVIRSLLEI